MLQATYQSTHNLLFSRHPLLRAAAIALLLAAGAAAIALFVGVAGPLLALAAALAIVAATLMLSDTRWGFVALAGVVFVLPFATLPIDIGLRPSLLDAALGALFFVWLFKLVIGQERDFIASPIGLLVGLFLFFALFSFANGLTHSRASTFQLRRFAEILLGIAIFFVAINTVRSEADLRWVTRWLLLAGWACAAIAVAFYVVPEGAVWVLDRLARFDYPGGLGALRYVEDDPAGTMRAIGTAVDPNVLGGMTILIAALLAPQLVAPQTVLPRWVTGLALATALLALYLTYSRSALVGVGAAVGMLAVLKYRRLIPLGVVGLLLLLLLPQTQDYVARFMAGIAGEDLATQMRFGEYRDALRLIERYPFFGVGFTGVPDIDLYLGVSMLYLIIASNMGIIGLIIFVLVLLGFFVTIARAWRRGVSPTLEPLLLGYGGAVLGALVSGIFDHYWFNMTYPFMTVLFWLHLGLAVAVVLIGREQTAEIADGDTEFSPAVG